MKNTKLLGYRAVTYHGFLGETRTTAFPTIVVLPTRDMITRFRTRVNISERNLCELLTQIFDWFMAQGLMAPLRISPVVSMFLNDAETSGNHPDEFLAAFRDLVDELRACLFQMGFKELTEMHNGFNYAFYSLRGSDIVVTYLSNEPRN